MMKHELLLFQHIRLKKLSRYYRILFLYDEGKIILQENVEELKNQYSIFTVPSDQREKIEQYKPKIISNTLGKVSAVLDSKIEIEGAELVDQHFRSFPRESRRFQ